ncbi:hypothetical protein AHV66_005041 [Salmonella enterica subsp. enterica serovar Richmond]|nr:hypothetical protein [Salmonella enterica subsp. enterica serovar Richmond]
MKKGILKMARIQCNRDRGNNSFDGVICLARGKSLTVYYMLLFVLKNLYTANVIQNESTFSNCNLLIWYSSSVTLPAYSLSRPYRILPGGAPSQPN